MHDFYTRLKMRLLSREVRRIRDMDNFTGSGGMYLPQRCVTTATWRIGCWKCGDAYFRLEGALARPPPERFPVLLGHPAPLLLLLPLPLVRLALPPPCFPLDFGIAGFLLSRGLNCLSGTL